MQKFVIFVIYFLPIFLYGQVEKVKINGYEVTFNTLNSVDHYDLFPGKFERNGTDTILIISVNDKPVLEHSSLVHDDECGIRLLEIRKHKIIKNTIVIYSYWANQTNVTFQRYGFKKDVYTIDKNGNFVKLDSKIFIEDNIFSDDYEDIEKNEIYFEEYFNGRHIGMDFIYKEPKTEFEKEALKDYMGLIERNFNANFVLGLEQKKLEKEVRKALKKEIKSATKNWIIEYYNQKM
ncbi:hypothetical protein [Flavobacterium sp. I3-2]|uniref:hypothetical protein n=1 Tax=Flavobacterium sp. I3-2 TaxID=2748319 RepID=UPI0015AA3245|nr:hypothetical protein [Flavobacterium sp. I3-2]